MNASIKKDIINIQGLWNCKWYDDLKDNDIPKVIDNIEILSIKKNGNFKAIGHQPQFNLSYPLIGEIDPGRTITMIYRASKYPYEPNRGVICLKVSREGDKMEGKWYGNRSNGELGGGSVICTKIN